MRRAEVRGRKEDFDSFAAFDAAVPALRSPPAPRRIDLTPDKVEHGLAQLVLSLLEMVRQLVEKQALRRIEGGGLTPKQVEDLGVTLLRLDEQMKQLKEHFEVDSLNIDLGPLGNLIDEE